MGKILVRIVALERPSGLYHRRATGPRSLVLIESLAFTYFFDFHLFANRSSAADREVEFYEPTFDAVFCRASGPGSRPMYRRCEWLHGGGSKRPFYSEAR